MINRHRQSHSVSHHSSSHDSGNDMNRWIISYADFITLLFAFFVVMYSMSVVNVSKYRVLSDSLKETFSANTSSNKNNTVISTDNNKWRDQDVVLSDASILNGGAGVLNGGRALDIRAVASNFEKKARDLSLQSDIHISGNDERIEINLNSNILFESGGAEPSYTAEVIFEEIASQLKNSNSSIEVEGYTDNQAIQTSRYPSNWELASSRAVSVVQLLQKFGIESERLSAIGYGEFHPVASNDTAEGREKNRRVVLVLHRESVKRPVLSAVDLFDDKSEQVQLSGEGAK